MGGTTIGFGWCEVTIMSNILGLPAVASEGALRQAIDRSYDSKGGGIADIVSAMEGAAADVELVEGDEEAAASKVDVFELKESADEAPVVRLINMILVGAIRRGACEIRLEPYEQ